MGRSSVPKVTRFHLAQVRPPAGQPATATARSVPVFGFAIDHPLRPEPAAARQRCTVADWATAPKSQQQVVRGDEQIVEGVSILATPGHTVGHQSVLVEGGGRRVVIGAQVVWHQSELDTEEASTANVDPDPELQRAAVDSIRRLKSLEPEVILLSHCEAYPLVELAAP